jgi:class 3 adenylate cyclase/predicted ATPase
MKCPSCESDNREGAKFCNECGQKFELTCPQCGTSNRPGSKFCDECGHNLTLPSEPSPKPPPQDLSFDEKLEKIQRYLPKGLTEKILSQKDRIEGERKQVTVMFCDMEGFTALSESLGPEEAYSIMDQVYEILIHKVHDYEGTVNEMTGDGIMALFGAPIALEDAPQRAIRSAYAIHREMAIFSDKMKREKSGIPSLKMRIGIHTGPVVVGTLGNDLRVEFKAVGDTVNLASRMEDLADSGATYVTEETFKLTEGLFRYEFLGEKKIKGKREPVKAYRVIGPSSRRTRFDVSAERGLTPFVGRERESELLLDGFERAKGGRGQAFSIMAEAGVGKSRLLYEFRKAVANEDVTFLEGKCLSYSRGVAYHPVIDILKSNFDIREGDGDSEIREKVKRSLKILAVDEASTLPYILELLSVKDSDIDDLSLSPNAKKDRIIETLNRIVLKGSEIRPLIMAIEDLHWIDKSSEERFKSLLDCISGARVFLIFTYRPDFVHTWGGRSYHSQVNLNRLSNRESLVMVAYLLGTEDIDRDLEELILEKTEGVPFFIEEFIKSLKDLRVIERRDNTYRISKDIQTVAIPSTIQDVIMARVDSLPEGAKGFIQTVAVAGREFSHELMKRVTDLQEQELLSHLSVLRDSELLYERGVYPQSTYIFKHALIQDVAYHSLLTSVRQRYHRKIAQVLEEDFPEITEAQPELLGHHFTEATLIEQAIPYWQRAGEIAMRRSANLEAVGHLTRAVELLMTLPDTPGRAQHELTLQLALGAPLLATKGYAAPERGKVYTRAWELCQQIGETSQHFPVLFGLWQFYAVGGELQTGREVGKRLLSLAQRQHDPALLLEAHRALGFTLLSLGEFAQAREHVEHGIALYDPQQHRSHAFMYGQDPGMTCLLYAAEALWLLGYPDQARARSHEAFTLAQELDHPYSLVWAQARSARIHQCCRELQAVQERAESAIALARKQGIPVYLAWGTILGGWVRAHQGQVKEGLAQIQQGLADYGATGPEGHRSYFIPMLVEVYGKDGQAEEGLTVLDEALTTAHRTGVRYYEAELYRLKGELLLALSAENHTEVETCLRQAIDVASNQEAKSLELRAAMSLSRLWQLQSKIEEARKLLAEIYGWFTEGFDTADLKEAERLLEELS